MGRTWQATGLVAFILFAAACGEAPPGITPSPGDSQASIPSQIPVASTSARPLDPARPTEPPKATEQPAPKVTSAIARWSKPTLVRSGDCSSLTGSIDASGRYHLAAVCDGKIVYVTSTDGSDWKETSFTAPTDRVELDPQVTLDGDMVYVAYSRLAPEDGGCGDDGLQDIGVYTRFRSVADGSWSDPVRVGAIGDRLQSFRVVDGVLHLIITSKEGTGPTYYESQSGEATTRLVVPHAVATSLRVGDDHDPRIAFATGGAIRYARVDGTRLSIETVASSDKTNLQGPSLVLGPGDHAYIVWTQNVDGGGGCAGIGPGPHDGVFFGTDVGGSWKTTRLSKSPSETSLTLDPSSRRIDVILADGMAGGSLTHLTSGNGHDWISKKIAGTSHMFNPVIRLNPVDGHRTVFAVGWAEDRTGIYLMTSP